MRYNKEGSAVKFSIENCLYYDRKIWFVENDCNELYYYDIDSKTAHFFCKMAGEEEYATSLCGGLLADKDKLYMIPSSAGGLYEIDCKTKGLKRIGIDKDEEYAYAYYNDKAKFCSGHKYEDSVYLAGTGYYTMMEYNCGTGRITNYDEGIKELLAKIGQTERKALFRRTFLSDGLIYAPSCTANYVLKFDVITKKHEIVEIGSKKCYFSGACKVGDWCWLSPRGIGPIVKWNVRTNEWKELHDFPKGYEPCEFSYKDVVFFAGYLYFIPLASNMLIRINVQTEKIEKCEWENFSTTCLACCVADEKLYLISGGTGDFIAIDKDDKYEMGEMIMPAEREVYHKKYLSYAYQVFSGKPKGQQEVLYEDYDDALSDYMGYIIKGTAEENECRQESVGKKIFEEVSL